MNFTGYFDSRRTDKALLEASVARSAAITRSENFKLHFRQWAGGPQCAQVLSRLRQTYGHTFLKDHTPGCHAQQHELYASVCFSALPSADSLKHYFLLDYMKQAACQMGFVVGVSQTQRVVVPETGITIVQRYRLRERYSLVRKVQSWFTVPSYGLLIQLKLHSERPAELLIRYDNALAHSKQMRLARLMEGLLAGPEVRTPVECAK